MKKYSPAAVTHIDLKETDIGRPIGNLPTNIKLKSFIGDIKEVMSTGKVIYKEAQSLKNKWYHVMIMPYINQADNKMAGVIITFHDISEIKNIQKKLADSNKSLLKINAALQ